MSYEQKEKNYRTKKAVNALIPFFYIFYLAKSCKNVLLDHLVLSANVCIEHFSCKNHIVKLFTIPSISM